MSKFGPEKVLPVFCFLRPLLQSQWCNQQLQFIESVIWSQVMLKRCFCIKTGIGILLCKNWSSQRQEYGHIS